MEQFYDLLKLNSEFREYDFKKNYEAKIHLCEAAEKLLEEPDPVSAFHQLPETSSGISGNRAGGKGSARICMGAFQIGFYADKQTSPGIL